MKQKPTYQELEQEINKLRNELEIESKIKNSSLLNNILTESTDMSIAVADINLNVIFFNPKAEEIFGYKASEIIGKNLTEIHAMEKVEFKRVEYAIEIVRKTGNYEYWVNTETKYLKSNVRGIWNKQKEPEGFVLFTTDMTEHINSQKQIKKLSTAVEQSANTIIITDINGNIEYANKKFTDLTGYTTDEIIGQNARILDSGIQAKDYYAEMWDTITAGNTWEGEFCNKTKQGNLYWEHVIITPIKDKEKITNFLAIKEDITVRKGAELKLQKQNKELKIAKEKAEESRRLKLAFINNMSHEIRTPLNGISGFLELLQDPDLESEYKQEYINIINKSSDRLINTVTDIMEISKIETGLIDVLISEVSVNQILNKLHNLLDIDARNKGISFKYTQGLCNDNAIILTDNHKLYGILNNLIKNAIKFTDKGSVIFGYKLKADTLEFHIRDTGIGIPKDRHHAVFNYF